MKAFLPAVILLVTIVSARADQMVYAHANAWIAIDYPKDRPTPFAPVASSHGFTSEFEIRTSIDGVDTVVQSSTYPANNVVNASSPGNAVTGSLSGGDFDLSLKITASTLNPQGVSFGSLTARRVWDVLPNAYPEIRVVATSAAYEGGATLPDNPAYFGYIRPTYEISLRLYANDTLLWAYSKTRNFDSSARGGESDGWLYGDHSGDQYADVSATATHLVAELSTTAYASAALVPDRGCTLHLLVGALGFLAAIRGRRRAS